MGAVKKVFKSVGGLLGFGSSSSTPAVTQTTTEPTVTQVSDVSGDTSGQNASLDEKKKRNRGFASTQTSTILSDNGGGKATLG